MKPHRHKFRVTNESVFGLQNIHVVGVCTGKVDKKRCGERFRGIVAIERLEKRGEKRVAYYYTPPEIHGQTERRNPIPITEAH